MSELVISFSPAGAAQSLHMEGFSLGFLGDMSITRQTDILFHKHTQKWNIAYIEEDGCLRSFAAVQGFDGYEQARGFEVLWLNECRLLGVVPTSEEGLEIAVDLRVGYAA